MIGPFSAPQTFAKTVLGAAIAAPAQEAFRQEIYFFNISIMILIQTPLADAIDCPELLSKHEESQTGKMRIFRHSEYTLI